MGNPAGTRGVPSIRSFQMDRSGAGLLKNSVNLFRGDVNYTQTLIRLPGRRDGDGLDVTVALQYQSNVQAQRQRWNMDAPTGVVGLGWNLPMPVIRLEDPQLLTSGSLRYNILCAGVSSSLVQEQDPPPLFSMDASLGAGLENGGLLPESIRQQFTQRGLALSPQTLTWQENGGWRLQDDPLEQEYRLLSDQRLTVYDGGHTFQLVSYNFWKVIYYSRYERWSVRDKNGRLSSYGGGLRPTADGNQSEGDSIEWSVVWADSNGQALWAGNSATPQQQQQRAIVWHLCRSYSIFGEHIHYSYSQVRQPVGEGGLSYTKACYLEQITDAFGHQICFGYAEKERNDTAAEYQDPYKVNPDNTPDGFQSRYETRYLDRLELKTSTGDLRSVVRFSYTLANFVSGAPASCAKRLLTGLRMENANGDSLPGYQFTYNLESTEDAQLGAVRQIQWPTGGRATYHYSPAKLAVCTRSLTCTPPSPMKSNSSPRLWFGPDYVVVVWRNTDDGKLGLQIYSWKGGWWGWMPAPDSALLATPQNLDPESIDVTCGSNFVSAQYSDSSSTYVHLFQQSQTRTEWWSPVYLNGESSGPTLQYSSDAGVVKVMAGGSFLIVTQTNNSGYAQSYQVLTYRWSSRRWSSATTNIPAAPKNNRWFGCGTDYYLVLDMAGNLHLQYLSADGTWSGSSTTLSFNSFSAGNLSLACGPSLAAISILSYKSTSELDYVVHLVQWNAAYQLQSPTQHSFIDYQYSGFSSGSQPVIVNNGLVAIAGNVLRFDGKSWQKSTGLSLSAASNHSYQRRFAYGADCVAVIDAPATYGSATAKVLAFDANLSATNAFSTSSTNVAASNSNTDNWPACGTDTLLLGTQLYFRGRCPSWTDALRDSVDLSTEVSNLLPGYTVNTASYIDESPGFVVCSLSKDSYSAAVAVFLLQNGAISQTQLFTYQKMWTPAEGGGNGLFPGGASMFCTYPSDVGKFSSTHTFTLHRFAANAVEGPLEHWPVTAIDIDDGLGESSTTTYAPDFDHATCDPTGEVVQYNRVVVYPNGSPSEPNNGAVTVEYVNLFESSDGYTDNMNGLIRRICVQRADQVGSGDSVAELTRSWTAYTERAGDPEGTTRRMLYGSFVVNSRVDVTKDGLSSTQEQLYVADGQTLPYHGEVLRYQGTLLNAAGDEETTRQDLRYACEVDEPSRVCNDLTTKVAGCVSSTVSGLCTPLSASASPLTGWTSRFGADVRIPGALATLTWTGGGDGRFDFENYDPENPPTGWKQLSRTTRMADNGTVLEQVDGVGLFSSSVYTDRSPLAVATFSGAPAENCLFSSFQDYEDASRWTLAGTRFDAENAWFGTRSLVLPTGASLASSVPTGGHRSYLFAFRYQTPSGYKGGGSGFHVGDQTIELRDTGGQWLYQSCRIDLPEHTETLYLNGTNNGEDHLCIDCVLLIPWGTQVTANSLLVDSQKLRGSMNSSGAVTFTLYDQALRVLGAVGGDGALQELDLRYLSTQGSADGSFDDRSPGAELTLQAQDGGSAETFRDGGGWVRRWSPKNPDLWSVHNGQLCFAGAATAESLVWQGTATPLATAAFFVELSLPTGGSLQSSAGFSYYDSKAEKWQDIAWVPGKGWQGNGNLLANPPTMGTQWLLVLGEGHILFFADGQLLFSHAASPSVQAGLVKFNPGTTAMKLHQLAVAYTPTLAVFYSDGAGRQRQVHQLNGNDTRITETLFDGLDREIAQTRVAWGTGGSGAAVATMQYRSSFVDTAVFLADRDNTGQMAGDIAACYPEDEGYAYQGTRYDGSALGRISECGAPGRLHALDLQNPDRGTSRADYGRSVAGDPVAAGSYSVQSLKSPSGALGRTFIDALNRPVATDQRPAGGSVAAQSSLRPSYRNDGPGMAGVLNRLCLPNYFGGGSDAASFVREVAADPGGQVRGWREPSTGATRLVYDANGLLRFTRVELEEGECWFLYRRYDVQGRVVEEGRLPGTWDESTLETKANNPDYPSATDGAIPARQYRYDGDGSLPGDQGSLTKVTTFNEDSEGDCTVTESWTHDALGRVATTSLELSGAEEWSVQVAYHYNTSNQILRIEFLDPTLGSLDYSYDDQSQLRSISHREGGDLHVDYTWTPEGRLARILRGDLDERFMYDSGGNPVQHTTTLADQEVFSHTFYHDLDGKTLRRKTIHSFVEFSKTQDLTFSYDCHQWLQHATDATDGSQLSVDSVDANGNIWAWTQGGVKAAADSVAGTDCYTSVTLGQDKLDFQYRKDGNPVGWRSLGITYDASLGITNAVENHATGIRVRYARGAGNNRILRKSGNEVRICFYGSGLLPLLVVERDRRLLCVWGSGGLDAVIELKADGTRRLLRPIKDPVGSVWAVVGEKGDLVAAFDYQPYGQLREEAGSSPESWLFRYASKEWDPHLGLYDFGARLYDPALLRFVGADAAHQFASPYVFSGNNPLDMVDPSGNLSVATRIAIGVGVIAASSLLAGLCPMAIDGAVLAVTDLMTEDLAAGAAAAVEEDDFSATLLSLFDDSEPAARPSETGMGSVINSTVQTSISMAGVNGVNYDIHCGRDFAAGAFFKSIGMGAASGAVKGLAGGIVDVPLEGYVRDKNLSAYLPRKMVGYTLAYVGATVLNTLLMDLCDPDKTVSGRQLGIATLKGLLAGVYNGAVTAAPTAVDMGTGRNFRNYILTGYTTRQDLVAATASVSFGTGVMVGYTTVNKSAQQGNNSSE